MAIYVSEAAARDLLSNEHGIIVLNLMEMYTVDMYGPSVIGIRMK